jgi:hypothetical protein
MSRRGELPTDSPVAGALALAFARRDRSGRRKQAPGRPPVAQHLWRFAYYVWSQRSAPVKGAATSLRKPRDTMWPQALCLRRQGIKPIVRTSINDAGCSLLRVGGSRREGNHPPLP